MKATRHCCWDEAPDLGLPNTYAHPLLMRTSGEASSENMVLMEIIDQVRARPAALQVSSLVAGCHLPLLFHFICLPRGRFRWPVWERVCSGDWHAVTHAKRYTLLESAVPK